MPKDGACNAVVASVRFHWRPRSLFCSFARLTVCVAMAVRGLVFFMVCCWRIGSGVQVPFLDLPEELLMDVNKAFVNGTKAGFLIHSVPLWLAVHTQL